MAGSRNPVRLLRGMLGSVATTLAVVVQAAVPLCATAVLGQPAPVPPEHDYTLQCSGCHRADGRGVPDDVPSLVGLDRFLVSDEGREYLIRAPGVAQAPVSDERLAALMNWVVVKFGASGVDPQYTAEEVGRLRARPLRDATELRERLLASAGDEP